MVKYLLDNIVGYPYLRYILDYGIYYPLILAAIVICLFLVYKKLVALDYDAKKVRQFIIILLVISYPAIIISARAANMFYQPPELWSIPFFFEQMIHGNVTTFHAGIFLPFLLYSIIALKMKFKFWDVFDSIFLYIPLGHAIGRLGCFLVGCCWGNQCHLSIFDARLSFKNPIPLYAIILNIALYIFLRYLYKKIYSPEGNRAYRGLIASFYLIVYGNMRLVMEFFRTEFVIGWGLTQAQIVAIFFMTVGICIFLGIVIKNARAMGEEAESKEVRKHYMISFFVFLFLFIIFLFVSDYLLTNQIIRWPFRSFDTAWDAYGAVLSYSPVLVFALLSLFWMKYSNIAIRENVRWGGFSKFFYFCLIVSTGYAIFLLNKVNFGIDSPSFWGPILILSLLNAVSEEVIFRLIIYKLLSRLTNERLVSNFIQSLLYSFVHIYIGGPIFALLAMMYGFILGLLMDKEDSLIPPIICHFIIDLGAIGLPMMYSG